MRIIQLTINHTSAVENDLLNTPTCMINHTLVLIVAALFFIGGVDFIMISKRCSGLVSDQEI